MGWAVEYMKKQYDISKEYLEEHYVRQGKSSSKICEELGIKSKTVILRLLKKYDIIPHKDRTGVSHAKKTGEIHQSMICVIKAGARTRGLQYELSAEYLWQLFLDQDRKCAISGLPLDFPITYGKETRKNCTVSLDRIDSSKGYLVGNVQWVHKIVNYMKMDLPQDEFIQMCKTIAKNNI